VQSVVTVFVKSNPLSAVVFTNASCTNSCSGKASATSSNGTGPYSYSLSASSCNTLPCLNLCVGNYTLLTTDALGCASKNTFTISAPVNNLLPIASSVNSSCNNCSTGSTSVSVSGGLAPYTWSPINGNSAILSGLLPGCYTVSISDANFCRTTAQTCVGVSPSSVGLNDLSAIFNNLTLYPNPAQNIVWIEFPGVEFDYQLYNDLGQLLKENKNNSGFALVNVDDFAKGIYIITINRQGAKTQKKLVIE
jgi:Secretion system C-terminal sorting domain/SprB repeat